MRGVKPAHSDRSIAQGSQGQLEKIPISRTVRPERSGAAYAAKNSSPYFRATALAAAELGCVGLPVSSAVSSAIVGPRTEAQWDAYTGALDVKISAEDEAFIDSLVTPGHSSTPGFNDVGHFVSGRMPRA